MATPAPRPSTVRAARGVLAVASFAIALSPHPALARCDAYALSFCRGLGFCVRTDTVADSGALDDPAAVLAAGLEPVSVSQTASDSTTASAEATGDAAASVGTLSLFASTNVVGTSRSGGSSAVTFPFALLRIDDLVFSGPAPSVETSLLLDFEGTLDASAANVGGDGVVQSNLQIEVNGNLCESNGAALVGFFGARGLLVRQNGAGTVDTFPTSMGILDGAPIDGTPVVLATEPFQVPTGMPLQLELWITMSGGALIGKSVGGSDSPSGSALASGDFVNGVRLPEPGPVFTLPQGFTVDSVQAAIENNRLPEPGDTLACGAALAVLLALRRSARGAQRCGSEGCAARSGRSSLRATVTPGVPSPRA